jgi:hypothetical protein
MRQSLFFPSYYGQTHSHFFFFGKGWGVFIQVMPLHTVDSSMHHANEQSRELFLFEKKKEYTSGKMSFR